MDRRDFNRGLLGLVAGAPFVAQGLSGPDPGDDYFRLFVWTFVSLALA